MKTFAETNPKPSEGQLLPQIVDALRSPSVWAVLILIVLFIESIICSLAFAYVGRGSDAPPAPSGTFVMWTVGVIGFQLAVVPTILVSFHRRLLPRMMAAGFVGFAFWGAHWAGLYLGGTKFGSPDFNQDMLYSFPIGCAIVGALLVLLTLFFRLRLKLRSDPTKGKPVSIGKLMGLTAVIAATIAYSTQIFQGDFMDEFSIFLAIAVSAIVGGLVFLIAIFGIRRERNLLIYAAIRYGVLTLIVWGGVSIAALFVGRGMLMRVAFYVSFAAASLIFHSVFFTYALKLFGFRYVKVESQLNS